MLFWGNNFFFSLFFSTDIYGSSITDKWGVHATQRRGDYQVLPESAEESDESGEKRDDSLTNDKEEETVQFLCILGEDNCDTGKLQPQCEELYFTVCIRVDLL